MSKEASNIFISYRRADTQGWAGRVHDRLIRGFAPESIYMDVDSIELGVDFFEGIKQSLKNTSVVIVIIGKDWLSASDERGRRIDNPDDPVRFEIETALQQRVRLIPILVDTVKMPRASELPTDIASLAHLNAFSIRHESFHADMDRLIKKIQLAMTSIEQEHKPSEAEAKQKADEKRRKTQAKRKAAEVRKREEAEAKRKAEQGVEGTRGEQKPAATLSAANVKKLLKKYGFFDIRWNKAGQGITNYFEADGQVVYDDRGLCWEQSGSSSGILFKNAATYIEELNDKKYGGNSDWRLPTLEEAMSLMEPTKQRNGLFIDEVFDTLQEWIWTADKNSASRAWVVHFLNGFCNHEHIDDYNFVRAVRGVAYIRYIL